MNMKPILIASHDIGGANNLAYWVKDMKSRFKFSLYTKGPAEKLFGKALPSLDNISSIDEINNYDAVLLGTGWQTKFEKSVLSIAKERNIYTCSYIDHWVNYSERFLSENGRPLYPDEIWVGDKYAKEMAENKFRNSNLKIRYVRNRYELHLSDFYKEKVSAYKLNPLICLEPVRDGENYYSLYDKLSFFIGKIKKNDNVVIRVHPSGEYCGLEILKSFLNKENVAYLISNKDLEYDLKRCNSVYGYQSSVLAYVKSDCTPVYSYYPSNSKKVILPHEHIMYLDNMLINFY